MRRYSVRFLIIAVLIFTLLDINKNPETNYTTQLQSTVTGQTFDIHEELKKASSELEKVKVKALDYIKELLTLFGYETEKGE